MDYINKQAVLEIINSYGGCDATDPCDRLMGICNRAGWSEWVTVDNLRLMAAMQMGREATLIKARDELIKAGLIEYQKGKKEVLTATK